MIEDIILLRVSIFLFIKWFSEGQALKSFPIFLWMSPARHVSSRGLGTLKKPPLRRPEDRPHTGCVLFLRREAAAHFLTLIRTSRIKDCVRFASSRDFRVLTK